MAWFIDTSALYSLMDTDDECHAVSVAVWNQLRAAASRFITTNYVIVETFTLLQRRSGIAAAKAFAEDIAPLLEIEWINNEIHDAALIAVLAANRRELSLVDCVSFAVMHRRGLRQVFTLDAHFRDHGFECLPEAK